MYIPLIVAVMNDGEEFEKVYHEAFSPELELKREHREIPRHLFRSRHTNCKFFFSLKFYDKRDSFPFSFVRMPYCICVVLYLQK